MAAVPKPKYDPYKDPRFVTFFAPENMYKLYYNYAVHAEARAAAAASAARFERHPLASPLPRSVPQHPPVCMLREEDLFFVQDGGARRGR
jgi:hypothetical protein